MRSTLFSVFIFLAFNASYFLCLEREMTINVQPGQEDCFFQDVKAGETIDFDYQVIDGGHGDLDISFHVFHPTGRILVSDYKKSENTHRFEIADSGDYKFCFDNKFSSYSIKTVMFEILVEDDDDKDTNNGWESDEDISKLQAIIPEDIYEIKLQYIKEAMLRVHSHLAKARHLQDLIKSFEARDRNVAEENFFKVNSFSFVQGIVMVLVGFVQVIMVKSLFDDSSRIHKFIKKLNKS